MNLLLDSNVVLWWAAAQEELSTATKEAIDTATSVSISLASPWELQIKARTGKLDLGGVEWKDLEAGGVTLLAPTLADVLLAADLPQLHRDPFDRLIIAQARLRGLVVVTRDHIFQSYGAPVIAA